MSEQNPAAGSTRRAFLTALTAASYRRILGANDRIQIGFIGYGLINLRHVADFRKMADVDCAAICEVYQPRLEAGLAACGPGAKGYADFRKMYENKDIQAVVVGTPDHWHALQTILACEAGKDVYVEKPVSLFVKEGRWMVTAARRFKRVVTTGTQRKTSPHVKALQEFIASGGIGKVHSVRSGSFRNVYPGFGKTPEGPPPPGFDYDMWLGPAPKRPYSQHRSLYHFRWFWDYSGGQMTNLATHDIDRIQFVMNVQSPTLIYSTGGRFCLEDDGETPDTQDALFNYPGFTLLFSLREGNGQADGAGMRFYGTKGTAVLSEKSFEILPDMKNDPVNLIPGFYGHPPGGPVFTKVKPVPWIEPYKQESGEDPLLLNKRDWLDAIRSRRTPLCDIEIGHRVSTACHLANISLKLGRALRWDPEKEEVIGDREANAMLVRPYRKPWDEVLTRLKRS